MSQKSLEHLRVIVQINKPEENNDELNNNNNNNHSMNSSNNNNTSTHNCSGAETMVNRLSPVAGQFKTQEEHKRRTSSSNSPPLPTIGGHMKTEVIILDEKTIKLNVRDSQVSPYTMVSQKMQFDRVNYIENNDVIREELENLMNELIINKKSCCIIRVTCQHDMSIVLFYDRLIDQFDRKLQSMSRSHHQYKLQQCQLECEEIILGNECEISIYDNNNNQECANSCKAAHSPCKNYFRKTGEMLLWLLNEHRLKSQTSNSHEILTFTFIINVGDNRNKGHFITLKLHFFNIYCSMMLPEERIKWPNFMKNIGRGCCLCTNCNYHYSKLFMKLLPHLDRKTRQFGLCLFQVPNEHYKLHIEDTIDMLQMAHSIVKYRKVPNKPPANLLRTFSVDSLDGNETAAGSSNEQASVNSVTPVKKGIAFTISFDGDTEASPSETSNTSSFSFESWRRRRGASRVRQTAPKQPELDSRSNNNKKESSVSNNRNKNKDSNKSRNNSSSNSNRNINRGNNSNRPPNSRNNSVSSNNNSNKTRSRNNRNVNNDNNNNNNVDSKGTVDDPSDLYNQHYQNACKWFDKIENCYTKVYRARDIFFKHYFIDNGIVMMRYIEQVCTTFIPSPTTPDEEFDLFPELIVTEQRKQNLQRYLRRYAKAMRDFLALPEEFVDTSYVTTLTSYYEQKQQELKAQEAELKLKYFEQVKRDLCHVVDEEITNLQEVDRSEEDKFYSYNNSDEDDVVEYSPNEENDETIEEIEEDEYDEVFVVEDDENDGDVFY